MPRLLKKDEAIFLRRMKQILTAAAGLAFFGLSACGNGSNEASTTPGTATGTQVAAPDVPAFNPDSAYTYVAAQVAFGPRVPGSDAQLKCAGWMQAALRRSCDTIYRQETIVNAWDGKKLRCINLVGTINPGAQRRILLLTHWDSRPWADADITGKDQPVLAADDGASGVGVLLELVRTLKNKPAGKGLGIDVLLTDVEDYGKSGEAEGENTFCLGTQYWAKNPHVPGYKADYAILLDMVGARGARFPMEATSTQYAGRIHQQVWEAANRAGYSSFFPFLAGGGVTDDHKYINELAHIPAIDIINLPSESPTGFAAHWHTHNDNLSVIDKETLKAVGQTLLQVIFEDGRPVL